VTNEGNLVLYGVGSSKRIQAGVAVAFVCLLLSASCTTQNIRSASDTPNIQETLIVMAFNIRHGCGVENWGAASSSFFRGCTKRLDRVVSAIRSVDPDVVGLQEVDSAHVAELAAALDMNYAYSPHNPSGYGRWWGNAVLTKFEILDSEVTSVGGSGSINRSVVTAVALINDHRTALVSVHTDHRLHSESSITSILDHVESLALPTILIGDFNMAPLDSRTSLITKTAGFIDTAAAVNTGQAMGTFGGHRIDYIFAQASSFEVLDASVVAPKHHNASDHLAYYTKLRWK
jgi:endonuclease/exonuclease/phosphatase family metal-dependent hydrolase